MFDCRNRPLLVVLAPGARRRSDDDHRLARRGAEGGAARLGLLDLRHHRPPPRREFGLRRVGRPGVLRRRPIGEGRQQREGEEDGRSSESHRRASGGMAAVDRAIPAIIQERFAESPLTPSPSRLHDGGDQSSRSIGKPVEFRRGPAAVSRERFLLDRIGHCPARVGWEGPRRSKARRARRPGRDEHLMMSGPDPIGLERHQPGSPSRVRRVEGLRRSEQGELVDAAHPSRRPGFALRPDPSASIHPEVASPESGSAPGDPSRRVRPSPRDPDPHDRRHRDPGAGRRRPPASPRAFRARPGPATPNDLLSPEALDRFVAEDDLAHCRGPWSSGSWEAGPTFRRRLRTALAANAGPGGSPSSPCPARQGLDPELTSLCHAPLPLVTQVLEYFTQWRRRTIPCINLLRFLS